MPRIAAKKPGKPRPGKTKREVGENGLPPDEIMDASTATEVADAPPEMMMPETAPAEPPPAVESQRSGSENGAGMAASAVSGAPEVVQAPTPNLQPQRERREKHQRRDKHDQRQKGGGGGQPAVGSEDGPASKGAPAPPPGPAMTINIAKLQA